MLSMNAAYGAALVPGHVSRGDGDAHRQTRVPQDGRTGSGTSRSHWSSHLRADCQPSTSTRPLAGWRIRRCSRVKRGHGLIASFRTCIQFGRHRTVLATQPSFVFAPPWHHVGPMDLAAARHGKPCRFRGGMGQGRFAKRPRRHASRSAPAGRTTLKRFRANAVGSAEARNLILRSRFKPASCHRPRAVRLP